MADDELRPFPQALPEFMSALARQKNAAALTLRFAILSAARPAEVLGATWSEVDLKARVWMVPAERTEDGRGRRVRLSTAARAVLREAQASSSSTPERPVFAHPMGSAVREPALAVLLRRMAGPFGGSGTDRDGNALTLDAFRNAFESWTEAAGYPREVVEVVLARRPDGAADDAALKRLMEAWGKHCTPAKAGDDQAPPSGATDDAFPELKSAEARILSRAGFPRLAPKVERQVEADKAAMDGQLLAEIRARVVGTGLDGLIDKILSSPELWGRDLSAMVEFLHAQMWRCDPEADYRPAEQPRDFVDMLIGAMAIGAVGMGRVDQRQLSGGGRAGAAEANSRRQEANEPRNAAIREIWPTLPLRLSQSARCDIVRDKLQKHGLVPPSGLSDDSILRVVNMRTKRETSAPG